MNKGFKEFLFQDIVSKDKGFLRGPFGGSLKKEIFVPKGKNTYKVYEQGVVLRKDIEIGNYYIKEEYFNEAMYRFEVGPNDFLISCSGVNYGAIFQLPESIEKGIINQALLRIRLNNELINDKYFYYFFSHHLVNQIIGKKGDSNIPNFPPVSVLKKLKINIHSCIDYQKQIAKVLSDLDAKIEVNNKINAELEAMAKLIYDYWFVQFDYPNADGKPYKSSGGKMVYHKVLKREIPEGWEVNSLGDILKTELGGTPSTKIRKFWNGKIPWLNSGEIASFPIIYSEEHISEEAILSSATSLMPVGTCVLSITRHLRPSILGIDACANQSVVGILESEKLKSSFIYPYLTNEIPRLMTLRTGAQQPHINKKTVDDSLIVNPSLEVLRQYYKQASPIYKQIINNSFQNQKLSELRDWLLPMLMNGQVRVAHSHENGNLGAEEQLGMVAEEGGRYGN